MFCPLDCNRISYFKLWYISLSLNNLPSPEDPDDLRVEGEPADAGEPDDADAEPFGLLPAFASSERFSADQE